jgi:hypothetical protein
MRLPLAHAAQDRGGMAFRQHEAIAVRVFRLAGSNRISAKKSEATISAAASNSSWWPLPA